MRLGEEDERISNSESSSPNSHVSEEEEEGQEGYRPGGYHRVVPGEVIAGWRIERKLGWGTRRARCARATGPDECAASVGSLQR